MKCVVCSREAGEKGYCEPHAKAHEIIVKKYDIWEEAMKISWKEYLSEIIKNPLTGEWAKEVAEYLIKSGEKQSVTQG